MTAHCSRGGRVWQHTFRAAGELGSALFARRESLAAHFLRGVDISRGGGVAAHFFAERNLGGGLFAGRESLAARKKLPRWVQVCVCVCVCVLLVFDACL